MLVARGCNQLNMLCFSCYGFSFRYQLSDEPNLDGQDQDAAGEKVCTCLISASLSFKDVCYYMVVMFSTKLWLG